MVRTECLKEVDSMAQSLNEERIASASAIRRIKELETSVNNLSAGDPEAKELRDQMELEMLKWHQRYDTQVRETKSIKEELETQKAEVVTKEGVIRNMLDDATKKVTGTNFTSETDRLLIASLKRDLLDQHKKLEDANGTLTNQRWMLEQAEKTKLSPPQLAHVPMQFEELTIRASSAEVALLFMNARGIELEEEVRDGISCLKEYEKECEKRKKRARRLSRWYCDSEGYDFTDYVGGGTGWPEYDDDDDEPEDDHRLPKLMSGKQKLSREDAKWHDTTADKVKHQQHQSSANQAKPQATFATASDEAMAAKLSQEQYQAHASRQHADTLLLGQDAEPPRARVFSNEPSKFERVIMLNYRVAKMVNLMPWAYARALMTEFQEHMLYEEMMKKYNMNHCQEIQEHVDTRSRESTQMSEEGTC